MGKSKVTFDWRELGEGQELPPLAPPPDSPPPKPRLSLGRPLLLGGVVPILVAAFVVSAWILRQVELGQIQIHQELSLAVEAEAWENRSHLPATPTSSPIHRDLAGIEAGIEILAEPGVQLEDTASQENAISVEVEALRQDIAAVMVVTQGRPENSASAVGSATAYRQLRFYRWTQQGWQPTEPVPALWGQPKHLVTEHFDFAFRSRDAHAVQAVAAELDAIYEQMRRNFGLPRAPEGKRVIEVMVSGADAEWRTRSIQTAKIIVPSPALLRAPDFLANATILRQLILIHLTEQVMQEAIATHRVPSRWALFVNAVQLWQLWDLDGPLAAWREIVLQQLYVDLWGLDRTDIQGTDVNFPLPIPIRAETVEFCALYSFWWWQAAAVHQSLPPSCHDINETVLYPYLVTASGRDSNRFLDLMQNSSGYDELTDAPSELELTLAAELLDYIAATYSREQITALWPMLQEHNDWETLIPAAFGLSIKEFEAGWQAYVADMIED